MRRKKTHHTENINSINTMQREIIFLLRLSHVVLRISAHASHAMPCAMCVLHETTGICHCHSGYVSSIYTRRQCLALCGAHHKCTQIESSILSPLLTTTRTVALSIKNDPLVCLCDCSHARVVVVVVMFIWLCGGSVVITSEQCRQCIYLSVRR